MIDLLPDSEQQLIIDSIQSLLTAEGPMQLNSPRDPYPSDAHQQVLGKLSELGMYGLSLPEDKGGVGYSLAEEVLAYQELGRGLASPSALATALAARLMAESRQDDICTQLLCGEASACFAIPRAQDRAYFLVDNENADWVVLIAGDRLAMFPTSSFEDITGCDSLDHTVTLRCAILKQPEPTVKIDSHEVLRQAYLLIAAMQVGAAEAARDMAVEYAKIREQFGQPIGAFQAVKHMCANMAVEAQAAVTQTRLAALACANQAADAGFLTHACLVTSTLAAQNNSATNIQVHGGIGFTAECEAHLYLKRSHLMEQIAGGIEYHEEAALAIDQIA